MPNIIFFLCSDAELEKIRQYAIKGEKLFFIVIAIKMAYV